MWNNSLIDASVVKETYRRLDGPWKRHVAFVQGSLHETPDILHEPQSGDPGPKPYDSGRRYVDYYKEADDNPAIATALSQIIFEHYCMRVGVGGVEGLYPPCGITGGIRADQLAMKHDRRIPFEIGKQKLWLRHNSKLDRAVGAEIVRNDVIEPNKRNALGQMLTLHNNNPDKAIVSPFLFEGTRIASLDENATGRRPRDELDYMAGWTPTIGELCAAMAIALGVDFSRNSIWERMRGRFIQLGYLNGVSREDSRMSIDDGTGERKTIADDLEGLSVYLLFALENDFFAEEAATAALWMLDIDRRLRDPKYNAQADKPIDALKIDAQLREEYASGEPWAAGARAKTDRLRAVLEPMLKNWFVAHIRDDSLDCVDPEYARLKREFDPEKSLGLETVSLNKGRKDHGPETDPFAATARSLPEDYEHRIIPAPASLDERLQKLGLDPDCGALKDLKSRLSDLQDYYKPSHSPRTDLNAAAHTSPIPWTIVEHDVWTESRFRARQFERGYFDRVPADSEKFALRSALAAMMTVIPPKNKPGAVFVALKLDYGENGAKLARELDNKDPATLEADLCDPARFEAEVRIPNILKCEEYVAGYREKHFGPVQSSVDILGIKRVYAAMDKMYWAELQKTPKLSPEASLALQCKMLDMMTDTLVLRDPNWADEEETVELVNRATQIQLGLVDRGGMHSYNMVVTNAAEEPLSFYDRFRPVFERLKENVRNGVNSKAHARAVAQWTDYYRQQIDPGTTKPGALRFEHAHASLRNYRQDAEMRKLYNEARTFMLENCADPDWFDADDITEFDAEFRAKWDENKARKDQATIRQRQRWAPTDRGRGSLDI